MDKEQERMLEEIYEKEEAGYEPLKEDWAEEEAEYLKKYFGLE